MSRILPILFNTEMVRAILREINPKTTTRRAIKGFIPEDAIWGYTMFTPKGYISCRGTFADGYGEKFFKLPCQPGDILYVRETWCNANKEGVEPDYYYYADVHICEDYDRTEWKWRPSIHMPKEAARIWLKVKGVRVERLRDITEEGAIKEGLYKGWKLPELPKSSPAMTAKQAFMWVWDSTIKKSALARYGWAASPWVWVIEFERCEKPKSEK